MINLNLPSIVDLLSSKSTKTEGSSQQKIPLKGNTVEVLKDLGTTPSNLNKYEVVLNGKKTQINSEVKLVPTKNYQAQLTLTKAGTPTLTKLITQLPSKLNTKDLTTELKLSTINVLKDLGKDPTTNLNRYSVILDGKKTEVQSQTKLQPSQLYQAKLKDATPQKPITLSNVVKIPLLFKTLQHTKLTFTPDTLQTLLEEKSPHESLKSKILQQLPQVTSKEEFHANSSLLLSLSQGTFSIPVEFQREFALLQFKKRYNKERKSVQLDFYATLALLGPVSGVVLLEDGIVYVMIHVAYEQTQQLLKESSKEFSYDIEVKLHKHIEPLFDTNINSLLDIKT